METAESRAKLANAIRDLQSKGQTQAIPTLVSAYKSKYKSQQVTQTVAQQKAQLQSQGQATSVRKDRIEPTFVGGILREVIKQPIKAALSVARPFVDPLGKKKDFSLDSKYLGNVGDYNTEITKSVDKLANKYNAGDISLGRAVIGSAGAGALQAMDAASVVPVGGVAGSAVKGTLKEAVIPTLKTAAKESLIRGGAVGAGYDVSSQLASGEKYNPLQTVAAGTVGTVADLGLSYGLPKAISGTKSFAKNNLTKAGRDAKLTRKVEEELFNIENNYAKLRKNQKYSKDANTATRKRIVTTGVLDDAVDTNGTINADNAIKKYRDASGLSGKEGVVRQNLERLGEKLNIKDAEKQLTDTVYTSGLEGAELRTALNNVKKEVSGYRLRADADGNLPLTFFHDAKIGTTNSIDFNTPADIKAYKKTLASGLKDIVENNSQFNVKEVNKELSPLFKDIEYLESLNGRKVKGGKLGKYASQVTGNIVGGVAGGAIGGFPGSAIGTVVGGEVGSALRGSSLSKVLRGPGAKELPVSKVLQKAATTAKSPRLGLPEPKAGLPKSQNFVPIELPGVKEPVYRSPRISGNTTQYTNIPNTKPKNIDIPTELPKSKVKSSDLSTGVNKVAYHGTQAKQIVGTPNATDGSMGKAFYVTDNKGKAEVFGKEKNVLNQVITNNKGKKVKQYARESGYYKTSNVFDINLDGLNIKEFKDSNEFFKYISNSSKKDIPDWFKLSGYDGAYIKDSGTYAIYSPEKIKMPKGINTQFPGDALLESNLGKQSKKYGIMSSDLSTEAKKYKSAEEFVNKFYEVTDSLNKNPVTGTDMVNRSVDREFKLKVLKHLQSPEVEKLYQKGMRDKEILTDFYRKTINDINKKPKLLRKDFNSSEEYLKAFNERVKPIDDLTKKELPKKKGIIGNAIDTLKTLKDKNVRERGSISLESILPESKSVGSRGVSLAKNTTEDLVQQAKKYKSAEEFVKALKKEVSEKFGIENPSQKTVEDWFIAKQKGIIGGPQKELVEATLNGENTGWKTFSNASKDLIDSHFGDNSTEIVTVYRGINPKETKFVNRKLYNGDFVTGKKQYAQQYGKVSEYKINKKDLIYAPDGKEILVANGLNPIQKPIPLSQLTDIWNKTNKKVTLPKSKDLSTELVQQAKKYKSAEELFKGIKEALKRNEYNIEELFPDRIGYKSTMNAEQMLKSAKDNLDRARNKTVREGGTGRPTKEYAESLKFWENSVKEKQDILNKLEENNSLYESTKDNYSNTKVLERLKELKRISEDDYNLLKTFLDYQLENGAITDMSQLKDIWNKANKK